MSVTVILTGPAGAGKNTIGVELGKLLDRLAVIDGDDVRQMLKQPHKAPWEGDEGAKQHGLGLENNCLLARSFADSGYNVLILDVVTQAFAARYRSKLKDYPAFIVSLLPSRGVIRTRNQQKPSYLQESEIDWTYQSQEALDDYDERIDNSLLSASDVARHLEKMIHGLKGVDS